ncbi:serine protease Do [Mycoplana sp. BE70]|uniref:DegQ family serine endoprotease n=1 Tax=Mycoplana sp. BE70 TaxID=2817775 RepID=UPI00285ADDF9|nr:DegQ family serine endoprotease [Mycoplana sp. BE70]MDR6754871.1 serine protease Do [Mycoplana sp. BE70]
MATTLHRREVAALFGVVIAAAPIVMLTSTAGAADNVAAAPKGAAPTGVSDSFAPIVSVDRPAVVTIEATVKEQDSASADVSPGTPFGEQFHQFFGDQGDSSSPSTPLPQTESLGSGFIIASDGYIVTNNHVIENATSIKVTLDDGTELTPKLVGADPKSDLAVLKVQTPKVLSVLHWGDSDVLSAGDQIIAIGNPFGIGTTVTAGIVSARGRDLHSGPYDDFIQIDAPINRGNSGGPLVDRNGEVVGINTAIYSPNGGSVGVGFAIPSDQARKVVAELIKDGTIAHGLIGVMIQPVTDDVAEAIGLPKAAGALVAGVKPGEPAALAGVKAGDVITAFGKTPISSPRDLSRVVADLAPGTPETVTVWRRGKSNELSITIGQDQAAQQSAVADTSGKSDASAQRRPTIGIHLGDITPGIRRQLHLPRDESGAVITSVAEGQPAADAGLQPGDVIMSVNQQPVTSAKAAKAAVADAGRSGHKSVLLLVRGQDGQSLVTVPFAVN